MKTKNKGRMMARDTDNIRSTQPARGPIQRSKLSRLTRVTDMYFEPSIGVANGWTTINCEVGDVTYRAILWSIKCKAAIEGVTVTKDGLHYVIRSKLKDYISEVKLDVNGTDFVDRTQSELNRLNDMQTHQLGPVSSGFLFPGDKTYTSEAIDDVYALGTLGLKYLRLKLKLTDAWDADNMEIMPMAWAVDQPRAPSFMLRNEKTNTTFAGVGKHTYRDLPISDDIRALWIMGGGISHITIKVDGDELFSGDRFQYESFLIEKGRNVLPAQDDWYFDMHAEGIARSIAALDTAAERQRDARIELELKTTTDSTPVVFDVTTSDLFAKLR